MATAQLPMPERNRGGRSSALWRTAPGATPPAAHTSAPAPSKKRNAGIRAPIAPARGGATVEEPGTNLATTSEGRPYFSKIEVVCRTQESGESETRQIVFRTRNPYRR